MTTNNGKDSAASVPSEPPKVVGSGDTSTLSRAVASKLAEEIRARVERTGCPAYDESYKEALERQAEAEIAAATPPSIDRERSLIDQWVLATVDRLYTEIEEQKDRVRVLVTERIECGQKLTALIAPLPLVSRLALGALAAFVTGLAVLAVGYLIAPSVDTYLLRSYAEDLYPGGAEQYSAAAAVRCSLLFAGALLIAQFAALLSTSGRLGHQVKVGFIVVASVFSGAFCMLRLSGAFAWQAVAVSAFELSILLMHELLLAAVASRLATDAERREAFLPVAQAAALAERSAVEGEQQLATLKRELQSLLEALDARETAVRQHERNRELVKATAASEYLTSLAELVTRATEGTAEKALSEMNESHLKDAFAHFQADM